MPKVIPSHIKTKVIYEIGDLLWRDTRELMLPANRLHVILELRGFRKRQGLKYDWVKYIDHNVRIHIRKQGLKGKAFYHIDFH